MPILICMDKKPRRTNRPLNTTFYLGKDRREERVKRLDALADKLAGGNRSVLLQKIADGDLLVIDPHQEGSTDELQPAS
jgi:hypothetical protein